MPMHVHLHHALIDAAALRRALDPAIRLTIGPPLPSPPEYEILVAGRPTAEQLRASPALRRLVIPWAGLPAATHDILHDFPHLAVHNLHHNAVPTAEMAVALLLAAAKRLVPIDRRFRAGDWSDRYGQTPAVLLAGKTALILGYGAIGRRVAAACRGLGMHVLGVRRQPEAPADAVAAEIHGPEALPALLPRAHALIVCLPLTAETDGLIGAVELALLPPGALLVNVGRGPVVDEAALYAALREGRLAAAGSDVWYRYPESEAARASTLPATTPLHTLDNLVMSPHRAGMGGQAEIEALRVTALADLLNAAARGQPVPNRVEVARGY